LAACFALPLCLCAFATAYAAAPPPSEHSVTLPLAAFRYGSGVTVPGSDPSFSLYVPVFGGARRFEISATVSLPANISPRARVELLAGGRPLASELAGSRRRIELHGSLPAPRDRNSLEITVRARLALDEQHCEQSEARSLYLFIAPETKVVVTEATAPPATVAGFFDGYDARFVVAADPKASAKTKLQRLALGYGIHRVVRWRTPQIALSQTPDRAARRIVVGDFDEDLRIRDGTLYASPAGVDAITAGRVRLVIGSSAARAEENATPDPRRSLTLDALGLGTRTQTGAGSLAFPVDTTLSIFRGRPSGLRFIIDLTHTALDAQESARLDVLAGGTVLNSFTLSRAGGRERFDVPIDDRFLRAAQNLVVSIDYLPHGQTCAGTANALTASLLGSSRFEWNKTLDVAPSVGDFFDTAFGTLDAGLQDETFAPATFDLLDQLGNVNPRVRRVVVRTLADAQTLDGDASIEAATAQELGRRLPLALAQNGDGYTVTDGGGTIVFRAAGADSFAVLQTFAASPPKLTLTYAGSPAVLTAVKTLPLAALTQAGNDVLVFNAERVAYTRTAEIAQARTLPPPFIKRALPMVAAALAVLLLLLIVIVRRARRVS
jgi:hypothetical protein